MAPHNPAWSRDELHLAPSDGRPPMGVVALIRRDDRYLLIERGPRVRAAGWWCLPGGALEPGESEEAALVREVREELGIVIEPTRQIGRFLTAWGVDLAWWAAAWEPRPGNDCLVPDPAEVAALGWFTRDEALGLRLLGSNVGFFRRAGLDL